MEKDFIPYGPEWEKELMKLPKKFLIDRYREACQGVTSSSGYRTKLDLLVNFVNQEMGNTVEWNGDYWQWKK